MRVSESNRRSIAFELVFLNVEDPIVLDSILGIEPELKSTIDTEAGVGNFDQQQDIFGGGMRTCVFVPPEPNKILSS